MVTRAWCSCEGVNNYGGYALTLIDTLDTLVLLNHTDEFERGVNWVVSVLWCPHARRELSSPCLLCRLRLCRSMQTSMSLSSRARFVCWVRCAPTLAVYDSA